MIQLNEWGLDMPFEAEELDKPILPEVDDIASF